VGVRSLAERFSEQQDQLNALPSRVAGLAPRGNKSEGGWDPSEWVDIGVSDRNLFELIPRQVRRTNVDLYSYF